MRKGIVFILLLLITSSLLNAQVSVSAKTDKAQYLIGDYIRVQLNVTADSTYILDWPNENGITTYDLITSNPVSYTHLTLPTSDLV